MERLVAAIISRQQIQKQILELAIEMKNQTENLWEHMKVVLEHQAEVSKEPADQASSDN